MISRLSMLTSKAKGCSGNSFKASNMVFEDMANLPSLSHSLVISEVDMVVSVSEAVTESLPLDNSNRKQFRIGNVFLEMMTRLMACKWLRRAVLETTNFIIYYFK